MWGSVRNWARSSTSPRPPKPTRPPWVVGVPSAEQAQRVMRWCVHPCGPDNDLPVGVGRAGQGVPIQRQLPTTGCRNRLRPAVRTLTCFAAHHPRNWASRTESAKQYVGIAPAATPTCRRYAAMSAGEVARPRLRPHAGLGRCNASTTTQFGPRARQRHERTIAERRATATKWTRHGIGGC